MNKPKTDCDDMRDVKRRIAELKALVDKSKCAVAETDRLLKANIK